MAHNRRWHDIEAAQEARKYSHPIPSRTFLIQFFAQKKRPVAFKKICTKLKLTADESAALKFRLAAMVRDKQLTEIIKNKKYYYISLSLNIDTKNLIRGRVYARSSGFGILITAKRDKELFISQREMRRVLHLDLVLTQITKTDTRGRTYVKIIQILAREYEQLIGYYNKDLNIVTPAFSLINQPIYLNNSLKLNTLEDNQLVLVKLIYNPKKFVLDQPIFGEIIKTWEEHSRIKTEICHHAIKSEWHAETLQSIKQFDPELILSTAKQQPDRKNLRHLGFITIDGEDARDFDDAVYVEKLPKKQWKLFIAIADVSEYVQPNSAFDQEALRRGTSIYFPGHTIPMLPEILSQEFCSLRPEQDRLVLICELLFNDQAIIKNRAFYLGVIHSKARLTYNQVDRFIQGESNIIPSDIHTILNNLYKFYQILNQHLNLSLPFYVQELYFELNTEQQIKSLKIIERQHAHRLIELFMIQANLAAAAFLDEKQVPFLYRVHMGPKRDYISLLMAILKSKNLSFNNININNNKSLPAAEDYLDLLTQIKGRPDELLLHILLLRSLSPAYYTPDNRGHFSLRSKAYTHFTSPIRRYPDLLTHRAIKSTFNFNSFNTIENRELSRENLLLLSEHCSYLEKRADDASRELVHKLKLDYLLQENKLNQEKVFSGIISDIFKNGFYVSVYEILSEFFIPAAYLSYLSYQFDEKNFCFKSKNNKNKTYYLGLPVQVKIDCINLEDKKIIGKLVD